MQLNGNTYRERDGRDRRERERERKRECVLWFLLMASALKTSKMSI